MWWPEASAAASRPRGDARRDADRAKDAKPVKRLSEAIDTCKNIGNFEYGVIIKVL